MSEPTTTPSRDSSGKAGLGLFGVAAFAAVVLGVLKLLGLVEMGWLIVFMPLLVALGLSLVAVVVGLVIIALAAAVKS